MGRGGGGGISFVGPPLEAGHIGPPLPIIDLSAINLLEGNPMKFDFPICGKVFKYETPADLTAQLKPFMDQLKKESDDAEALAEKKRKQFFVVRKAYQQFGGKVETEPAKTAPDTDPKTSGK